jgi:predicted dehydrogenase/type 1 glutamine amidotransferase
MYRVLLCADAARYEDAASVRAISEALTVPGNFQLTVTADSERLRRADEFEVVVALTARPLAAEQERQLLKWVRAGGGLVLLGETGAAWQENEGLAEAVGLPRGQWSPVNELIIGLANPEHPLTRRMDNPFVVVERLYLVDNSRLPGDAEVVLSSNWHNRTQPVGWVRQYGAGRVFYTGLGQTEATLEQPVIKQLVYRAVRQVAGLEEGRPVGVAMVGYGAIGFEHGTAVSQVDGLEFRAVCDRNPQRLREAEKAFPGIQTFTDMAQLADDPNIDLAIVSTPPNTHAAVSSQMLRAGKHVVTEKPFCLTTREADEMIGLAAEYGRSLTVYQNRRWDSDFLAIKGAVDQGLIGEVFHVETFIGGFAHPCHYWHSDEEISGGVFYDWGSHYLDWVLNLLPGKVKNVSAISHKRVWHDVTNADQSRLLLNFEGGVQAEFMHSDIAAALKPKWYILGTKGAIVADWRYETVKSRRWSGDLIEERLEAAESPAVVTVSLRDSAGLIHRQSLELPRPKPFPFHRNLADHLLTGEPLAVNPVSSRRNIAVMEAAKYSAAHEAETVNLDS